MSPLRKDVVRVGDRRVRFRRAGAGPVLVLLHGSPNSSQSLEPLMGVLSRDFDCIALDTPGNGGSSPLAADAPSTEDYAEALAGTVDALGLRRFSLYGFHTGAGTAAAYAVRRPERVASLVLDGVACWTTEEKAGMLEGYLPPFVPDWSGAHLAWLWSRVMEQTMFFPWHRPSSATRMDYDMPSPEVLQRTAMEFLRAGDHYRKPYAAALAGDGAARLARLRVAALVTAHPLDPIAHHLGRLGALHPSVRVVRETRLDRDAITADFAAFLRDRPGDPAPSAPRLADLSAGEGFVRTGSGDVLWRGRAGAGRPLVLLHGPGGASDLFAEAIASLSRPAVAFDLPAHGDSDGGPLASVEDAADAVEDALRALGLDAPAVVGVHLGGMVAATLKRRGAAASAGIVGAPVARGPGYAPDIAPRWDGGHLLAAWRFVRLESLYADWRDRRREGAFFGEPLLDADWIHARAFDLLRCGERLGGAYAAQDRWLAEHGNGARFDAVFAAPADPMSAPARLAALEGPPPVALPPHARDWGRALDAFAAR